MSGSFRSDYLRLAGIVLLAAVLRFLFLADNPPGLFRDEADKGYSTYSLIQTGKDLAGRSWPLQIRSFGAYTSPFYHWFSLPPIQTMGLSIFSTRLIAALSGTLACLAVYLVGTVWKGKTLGSFAALFLAISPWHLLFSRWANQGILMTLFIPLAVWATWKSLNAPRKGTSVWMLWGILSGLFWGISWNTYAPARLFVPIYMASIFAIQGVFSKTRRTDLFRLISIGLLSLLVAGPFVIDIVGRWEETQTRLRFLTGGEPFSPISFVTNYLKHWDPRYLFLFGDANPRHHIPGQGQLSVLGSFLFVAGVYSLAKAKGLWRGWLLAWLLLAPVPAAVTNEGLPHALRTLMMVPAFALVAGVGATWVSQFVQEHTPNRVSWLVVAAPILLQIGFTVYLLFFRYPSDTDVAPWWETGFIEAIQWTEENRQREEECVVTGMLEFPKSYFLFVLKPDPRRIQEGEKVPGYRFLPTGQPIDPRRFRSPGLYLERSLFAGKPSNWRKVPPPPQYEKMDLYWRLYRVHASSSARHSDTPRKTSRESG